MDKKTLRLQVSRMSWASRLVLTRAVDRAVLASAVPKRSPGRILVVRIDAIGDFILWLEAAKALRVMYPRGEFELTLLANRTWAPLAESQALFDRVWTMDRARFITRPSYRFATLHAIRTEGFPTAIHPIYSRERHYGDSVVRTSGAAERIGSEGDFSNISPEHRSVSDRWYTRLVGADARPLMELLRNAEFIRGLGMPGFRAGLPSLEVAHAPPPGLDATGYYVIFPGAGWPGRQWPLPRFSEVARRLHDATGWAGVVCGGPDERLLGESLAAGAGVPLQNWSGKTSLVELVAVIKGARILIGNETSAIHVAAAVSTPSVCITGGGHFGRFLPYQLEVGTDRPLPVTVSRAMDCFNCNWQCIHPLHDGQPPACIANVTVDDTWKAVHGVLGNALSTARRSV